MRRYLTGFELTAPMLAPGNMHDAADILTSSHTKSRARDLPCTPLRNLVKPAGSRAIFIDGDSHRRYAVRRESVASCKTEEHQQAPPRATNL